MMATFPMALSKVNFTMVVKGVGEWNLQGPILTWVGYQSLSVQGNHPVQETAGIEPLAYET